MNCIGLTKLIFVCCVLIWNSLPEHIRNSSSLTKTAQNSSFSSLKITCYSYWLIYWIFVWIDFDYCWMQHRVQIGGLCLMLCTDNNVTDAPLMERNWRKCVIICSTLLTQLHLVSNSDDLLSSKISWGHNILFSICCQFIQPVTPQHMTHSSPEGHFGFHLYYNLQCFKYTF